MKNVGIALLVFGIFLEAFAIFGNRAPYPLVLKLASPEYARAWQAYRTFLREGVIEEGDEGFDALRQAYMNLTLGAPEPPFPLDEIEGVTVIRFYGRDIEDLTELGEDRVLVVEYSNGETLLLGYEALLIVAAWLLKPGVALINAGLLMLGCVMVYYGLRVLFLDEKDAGEAAGGPLDEPRAQPGAA